MNSLHRFRHNTTAVTLGNPHWDQAGEAGLIDIRVAARADGRLTTPDGKEFVNMVSLSYLGLDEHPALLQAAIAALQREKTLREPISRLRIHQQSLHDLEDRLSELFRARVTTALSCSAATAGILPLIASGHLTDADVPVMVFDKNCHFSMQLIKPICADETEVVTCDHNDVEFIHTLCKKHRRVAYIADGVYSLGGCAPMKELLSLQSRYGLYLFFDESHSLSIYGNRGEGFVRSSIGELLNPNTAIVASLSKGFGSTGGVIMLGSELQERLMRRFGGPLAWSQSMNTAAIGAAQASAAIHSSAELQVLQNRLAQNVRLFDRLMETDQRGSEFQIRAIKISKEGDAIRISRRLYEQGFYVSAVFFPICAKGTAALRIILRANHTAQDIERFCATLKDALASI